MWPSPLLNVFLLGLGTERHVIESMVEFHPRGSPGKIYIHSSNQDKCVCDYQKGLIHHHPGGSGWMLRENQRRSVEKFQGLTRIQSSPMAQNLKTLDPSK